jgi:hypothetical protein
MTRPAGAPRNRPISTFVAAFAACSLAASVMPLLTRGEDSVIPALDRGTSFAVYSVFLLLFAFFVLPGLLQREAGRALGPWWALAALALLFGSIPGVVSAYISGVASPQALFVGALVASACAGVILLRAALGALAVPVTFAIGALTLFVVPAIEALCWSTGTKMAVPIGIVSVVGWLRRFAFLREPVDPRWMIGVASALWIAVVAVASAGRRSRVAAFGLLGIPAVFALGHAPPDVRIVPLLGPVARAGARIPVAVTATGGGGQVEVAFRTEALRVPADGRARTALVVLEAGESEAEVVSGADKIRVPLPLKWVEPARPLVAILSGGGGEEIRAALGASEVVAVDLSALPPLPGALEVFDAIVVRPLQLDALRPELRALLRGWAMLNRGLVVVGAGGAETRESWPGARTVGSLEELAALDLRRRLDPDPFDPTLKNLFAKPDWQALDLTGLVVFLLLYHGAFLAAFLLPLLLDSHKSTVVYLVSVGTVMIVVVLAAWWSLRQFFLRDNQVYTQSLTWMSVAPGGTGAVARQFRCYASMSGERRDFGWGADRDLVDYRDAGPPDRVLDLSEPRRLDDVWLDRFQAKLLVREDLAMSPPLVLVREDGGYRVRPVPDVPDPLGLRASHLAEAVVLEADGSVRAASLEGQRVVLLETAPGRPALDPITRALIGRFRPAPSGRAVVIRARGLVRLDDTTGFFKTADLDAVLAFETEDR